MSPRTLYLILHGLWVAILMYAGFSWWSEWWVYLDPEFDNPSGYTQSELARDAAWVRNQFYLAVYILIGALTSFVLILKKRCIGWKIALLTLLVDLVVSIYFLYQERENFVPAFSLFEDFTYSLYFLGYVVIGLGMGILIQGLLLWLMWYQAKRGVFRKDGV